ncbi:MAG TPA: hemerythrin domain-containing protein [Candidatus Sulfotelmatobacter sp.]
MLRNKNLVPLSRQHQHALALCVRIDRAQPISSADLGPWLTEMCQLFRQEISFHFDAEEQVMFPAARRFAELAPVVDELIAEHQLLRSRFAQAEANCLPVEELTEFAQTFAAHIRKEERVLFEGLQRVLGADEMDRMGVAIEQVLQNASQTCTLPKALTPTD